MNCLGEKKYLTTKAECACTWGENACHPVISNTTPSSCFFHPHNDITAQMSGKKTHHHHLKPIFVPREHILEYINIRGGTVHVFVPNRHGTDLSVRCIRPYNEYRQFTPIQKGVPAVMQCCLITASRRTANAMSCALENKAPRQ